ncbi:hypothetical protein [Actinotalea ferrariae]|uniref:hypothetical protein n=1 Tax=Actinotalea ferrariae TaxID=1386098 RepID=UPI0012DCFC08|nr:hypothetical protein [Actinotalea ferrariae]
MLGGLGQFVGVRNHAGEVDARVRFNEVERLGVLRQVDANLCQPGCDAFDESRAGLVVTLDRIVQPRVPQVRDPLRQGATSSQGGIKLENPGR